jgi:hypothetical protein
MQISESKNNFNYVFIAHDSDDIEILYSDLNKIPTAQLIIKPAVLINNSLLRLFYRLHTSRKINSVFMLPLKNIWNKKIYSLSLKKFDNCMPLCFIIYGRYLVYCGKQLIDYLRHTYPNCKVVCYVGDLIETYPRDFSNNLHYFDAVFSLDKMDATNHGFFFLEEPFSVCDIKRDPGLEQSDVTFIGSAKDRLRDILCVYEILQENGLTCDFHITGVKKPEQSYSDRISYNRKMSFAQVIQHVISSKCILEILQKNMSSPTTRASEAIVYGKKLLSNCSELMEKPYYNPNYISIFSNPNDIDIYFLKKESGNIDYGYIESLSLLKFVESIGNKLNYDTVVRSNFE